jgi:hypothetical protein
MGNNQVTPAPYLKPYAEATREEKIRFEDLVIERVRQIQETTTKDFYDLWDIFEYINLNHRADCLKTTREEMFDIAIPATKGFAGIGELSVYFIRPS